MPSVLTHLAFLEKVFANAGLETKNCIQQNWAAANWGAVGPDYLFFAPSDWSGGLGDFMKFIYDIQNDLQEVTKAFKDIEEFTSDAKDFLTGGLSSQLSLTADYLKSTLLTHIAAATTDKFDLFSLIASPLQKGATIPNWWWMDVTHHLATADYARSLWRNSASDPLCRAYTYGFLTHIAGDVVGHPFVNAISGGPYRLHPRRHVLVEKAFDSYLLQKWYGLRVSDCDWHKKILFEKDEVFPSLPNNLISFIHKSLTETYSGLGIKSGVPDPSNIDLMYRYFHKYLKGATSLGWLNLPPPKFSLFDMPQSIKDQFSKSPPKVQWPKKLSSGSDWKKFFESLFDFISYCVTTLIAVIAAGILILSQLSTAQFRYFLWLIQKLLYEIFLQAQLSLALGGFLHPTVRHFSHFADLMTPELGQFMEYKNQFPFQSYWNDNQTYHLIFPANISAKTEMPNAVPFSLYWGPLNGVSAPRPFFDVEGALLGDSPSGGEDLMAVCGLLGPEGVKKFISANTGFRSARTLSLQLFNEFESDGGSKVPNFNLDGDRGFAWPEWRALVGKPWTDSSFSFQC